MKRTDSPLASAARTERRKLLRQYTGCFTLTALLAFVWFYAAGRTFVWEVDGIAQHYRAMVYYADYLRAALRSLFSGGGLALPQWDFALGEGGDVLTSLHYYAFGDPFCLGAVLVPDRWMYLYYDLAVVLRLYCAGLAFLYLCRQTGQTSRAGMIAGSLLYVFCYWALRNSNRHPFFLNPMIYLPLILAGVERVLRGKGPVVLILSVFTAAISNFYFLYMHAVLTVLYVLLRGIPLLRREGRAALGRLAELAGAAVLGALMAAAILAPVVCAFLGDVRIGADNETFLLYPLGYYTKLPHMLLDSESAYWLCLGLGAPCLIALLLLPGRRRERPLLLVLLALGVLFLLFPFFGRALNGFAYVSNRWSWAFALLAAYLFTDSWEKLMNLSRREARFAAWGLGVYAVLCVVCYDTNRFKTLIPLAIAALYLLALWPRRTPGRLERRFGRQRLAAAIVILSLAYNAFGRYAPPFGAYALEGMKATEVAGLMACDETDAVKLVAKAADDGAFYRYSGRGLHVNASLNAGLSSTQYYYSLTNPGVSAARAVYGVNEAATSLYKGYDDRAALLAVTGVRYYAREEEGAQAPPVGFVSTGVHGAGYEIFRSENALPLAWTYDSWITREELESRPFAERQELLLHAMTAEEPVEGLPHWEGELQTRQIPAEPVTEDPEVTALEGRFVVTAADAEVTFRLPGETAGETLFEIRGLDFEASTAVQRYLGPDRYDPAGRYDEAAWEQLSGKERTKLRREDRYGLPITETKLTVTTETGAENNWIYYTRDYYFYNGRHDFAVNLRQSDTPVHEVRLRFSTPGIYTYDEIAFCVQPMEDLAARTEALREPGVRELEVGTDRISCRIGLDQPRLLCLSVPWSTGWTAEVDGRPAELMQANVKNMALLLEAGDHSVTLRYERPMGRLGLYLSLAGCLGFVCLLCLRFYLRNRKNRAILDTNQ